MEDKLERIKPFIKYLIPAVIVVVVLIIVFSGKKGFGSIEKDMVNAAKNYVSSNNIKVNGEIYIELDKLDEIEGTELCYKSSGVIVKNENGSLKYTPYLACDEYKTDISNNKNRIIVLNDDELIVLNKNEVFDDPLYSLKKDADVIMSGRVKDDVGVYTLVYDAYIDDELKERAIRKVIRVDVDSTETISGLVNKNFPTLTLNGSKDVIIYLGESYKEEGYTAYDYVDGKISRKVKVEPKISQIKTNKVGTYTIVYSVVNSRGNIAIATRNITVMNRNIDLNISLEQYKTEDANEVVLKITVIGDDYAYMKLPFSTAKNMASTNEYIAKTNGKYTFKVYDRYGNEYLKEAEVDNIDSIAPSGTCEAVVDSTTTNVKVTATDNKGISGYNYILDGKPSEYIKTSEYSVNKKSETVSVDVKDLSGNVTNLKCSIEKIINIENPSQMITCNGDRTEYNKRIEELVAINGPRTRNAAVAVAKFLSTEIGVKIPYFWAGGHWHYPWDGHDDPEMFKGVSPKWGCDETQWREFNGTYIHPAGIDCTGFVAWTLFNAGFKKSEIGSFSGEKALTSFTSGGKRLTIIDFKGSIDRTKPGDVVWLEGHMGFVIDVDVPNNIITVAHERQGWGLVVGRFSAKTGKQIDGHLVWLKVMLLDNYYE